MAYKDKEIEKLYFSIGEVAQMLDVNTSLLRYWESEFKELQVRKDRNGVRLFTKPDIEMIKLIYSLVKEKGFTIEGAKLQLKQNNEMGDNEKALARLLSLKSRMQKTLSEL